MVQFHLGAPDRKSLYLKKESAHMVYNHTCTIDDAGERIDIVLSRLLSVSRAKVQDMIDAGIVTVGGKQVRASYKVSDGQELRVGEWINEKMVAETMPVTAPTEDVQVLVETDEYMVVVKPAHMLTHATEAGELHTLAHWVVQHDARITSVGESPDRPGIVHRLDKEASGLLVIAKTQPMFLHLKKQFAERTIVKEYTVLVHGKVERDHGIIDFDIDRGKDGAMVSRPKNNVLSLRGIRAHQPGKEALTEYDVLQRFARFTLLKVRIHTGRMHQIRVHMFAFNHPVVGDTIYMNTKLNTKKDIQLGRLFLHAAHMQFLDISKEIVDVSAPLPTALADFLNTLN